MRSIDSRMAESPQSALDVLFSRRVHCARDIRLSHERIDERSAEPRHCDIHHRAANENQHREHRGPLPSPGAPRRGLRGMRIRLRHGRIVGWSGLSLVRTLQPGITISMPYLSPSALMSARSGGNGNWPMPS